MKCTGYNVCFQMCQRSTGASGNVFASRCTGLRWCFMWRLGMINILVNSEDVNVIVWPPAWSPVTWSAGRNAASSGWHSPPSWQWLFPAPLCTSSWSHRTPPGSSDHLLELHANTKHGDSILWTIEGQHTASRHKNTDEHWEANGINLKDNNTGTGPCQRPLRVL